MAASGGQKGKLPYLRVEITLDHCADGPQQRATAEALQRFFAEASGRLHRRCEVAQVDTAQIFHEKTDFLNPRTLPENKALWPKKLKTLDADMRKGRYQVEPPQALERAYYDALRALVFDIQKGEDAGYLVQQEINGPQDIHMGQLQALYSNHVKDMPKDSSYRQLDSFRHYTTARADCGEASMAQHIMSRDPSASAQKTVSLFVSLDRGALEQVAQAGQEAVRLHGEEVLQSHTVHPRDFASRAEALVQGMKEQYPECADIPFGAAERHHTAQMRGSAAMGAIGR